MYVCIYLLLPNDVVLKKLAQLYVCMCVCMFVLVYICCIMFRYCLGYIAEVRNKCEKLLHNPKNHMTSIWCVNKHTKTMKLIALLETELFAIQIFSRAQK